MLAILVLMSSTGVTVFKQTCLMMGAQTVALFHADELGCCSKADKAKKMAMMDNCEHHQAPMNHQLEAKECCTLSVDLIKAEFPQTLSDESGEAYTQHWTISAKNEPVWYQVGHVLNVTPRYLFTDSSPPLTGRHIIIHKQSFLL